MFKLITALTQLAASSTVLALDVTPPSINSDTVTSGENIKFDVWSRAGNIIIQELDPTVLAFTSKEIREKFLINPASYADRFYPVNESNFHELVVFTLLYEPFMNPYEEPSSCDNTWHYFLTVEQAPRGKRFAISRLIISESGEILFGSNASPYDWSEMGCPIRSNNNPLKGDAEKAGAL